MHLSFGICCETKEPNWHKRHRQNAKANAPKTARLLGQAHGEERDQKGRTSAKTTFSGAPEKMSLMARSYLFHEITARFPATP
jgi:hypothetical protein